MARRESNPKDLGCCNVNLLKYLLCVYNFVFLLSGCVVCGGGVWTILEKGVYLKLLAVSTYSVTAWLLVATGTLAVGTALLGYTATAYENRCLLALFTILLTVVFMFESIIGLLAYVYQEQIDSDLNMYLNKTFVQQYGKDPDTTIAIDRIQRELSCCGAVSYYDWRGSDWFQLSDEKALVPDSCCKTLSPGCGARDHPSNIPYTGCIHQISAELRSHLVILGAVGLGVALLQVLGVILTSCLFSRLHKLDKYTPVNTHNHLQQNGHNGYWTQSSSLG